LKNAENDYDYENDDESFAAGHDGAL